MPMKCYWNDKPIFNEELRWRIQNTPGFTSEATYKYFCDADGGCRNFNGGEGAHLHTWSLRDQRPTVFRRYCDNACRQNAFRDRKKSEQSVPQLQKCAREGCETTYINLGRGTKQLYCSSDCRVKAFRKRKQNSQE